MATRWEVEKAVLRSGMDPAPRLIVLALLIKSDNDTAVVVRDDPSLTTIAEMTGLARSTVAEWLNALEDAGWIKRTRSADSSTAPTTYALLIGAQEVTRRPRIKASAERTSPPAGLVVVRQPDRGSPPGGPAPSYSSTSSKDPLSSRRKRAEEPRRDDVEQVCTHLADRIEANGSKRPTITKTWRTEARLLLDKDGRTVEQITRCIDWCQENFFWRKNILSMPKLREKYDQLRLNAQDPGRAPGRGNHQAYRNPEDASAYHGDL